MEERLFDPLRKATRKNRFVKRDPEVITQRPNVFVPMRTCLDVAKSVGYLIRSLRCLILLHPTFTTSWNLNELHLRATEKSNFCNAQFYRSVKNEQEMQDDAEPYVPAEENGNKQLGSDIELVYALLGGPSEHQKELLCLARVDNKKEILDCLLKLRFTRVEIARVKYTAYGERFQHTITFLKPPVDAPLGEIQRINDDVAALGEWVVPSKKESGFSVDFSLHTTRIALALAREILEAEAMKHLCELETRETEELVVRLQERQQLISRISEKVKEQEQVAEAATKHKRKLQEKWEKNCCFLTDRERELLVASQREELEKIEQEVEQYRLKSKRKIALMEEKCVGLARRRQLHPSVDSMWVFRYFDHHGNGKVPTSVLRSALFGLETHLSAAAVNESLLRLGKESNVQIFRESTVSYTPPE